MLQIGQQVRVLPPFARDFPEVYTIIEHILDENNEIIGYTLETAGNFDILFLEVV